MHTYKFLQAQHAPSMMEGHVLLSRFMKFQLLETFFNDDRIGDIREGVQETTAEKIVLDGNKSATAVQLDSAGFIKVGPNANVTIENATFIQSIDCFILSLAQGHLADLLKVFAAPLSADQPGYDAAIQINVNELHALFARSVVEMPNGSQNPFSEVFRSVDHGSVSYNYSKNDFQRSGLIPPDPFRKQPKYVTQGEYRFVFLPLAPIDADTCFVRLPKVQDAFHRIYLPSQAVPSLGSRMSADEALQTLIPLLRQFAPIGRPKDAPSPEKISAMLKAFWRLREERRDESRDGSLIAMISADNTACIAEGLRRYLVSNWHINIYT